MAAVVPLVEYGDPVLWPGTDADLATLARESDRWKVALRLAAQPFSITPNIGGAFVRAEGIAGFIKIGAYVVEVRPKFLVSPDPGDRWKRALWRVLAFVDQEPALEALVPTTETDVPFPDLMAQTLLRGVENAALGGWPRGYVERRENLSMVRGRLDVGELWRSGLTTHLVPCVIDEFTEDIAINRLIRWAAEALAKAVAGNRLSYRLSTAAAAMVEIEPVAPGLIEAEFLRLPPSFSALEPALDVSRVLLRQHYLAHGMKDTDVLGFLWNSSEIFELCVIRLLTISSQKSRDCHVQRRLGPLAIPISEDAVAPPVLRTEPDASIRRGGRAIATVDAKYKVWRANRPRPEDTYQVLAGARVDGAPLAALVYPSDSPFAHRRTWRPIGDGCPSLLRAMFVNLSAMSEDGAESSLSERLWRDLFAGTDLLV